MYEYLLENLISYNQVDGNLRRTADRGLVSELYRRQMNALALKYFGVDKNGNYTENKEEIVSYRCPYSGELIKDLSTAHLEHILPVSSNGGTVLFNCIPILDKVNLSKGDEPNLLTWWQGKGKEYFSYDRLERLIQFMLEAYTLAFKEPTEEELYDYDNSSVDNDYIENDDLSIDLRSKSNKINNLNQNITYYQLLADMINELSKNRDVLYYYTELNKLKDQNIFGNIEEIEKVINAVQTVFKEVLGDDSKKYLSYSLKINMNKLFQSLDTTNYEQEIRKRFEYIQLIVKQNNITVNDFFENLQDIDDINLIYFDINKITEEQKNKFIENIRIGHNTKVLLFINMLKRAKSEKEIEELFSTNTTKQFTTYKQNENGDWIEDRKYGEIGHFWSNNKDILNSILQKIIVQDIELREKLDNYYMNTFSGQQTIEGKKRRIEIFIDMLRKAKSKEEIAEILLAGTLKQFTTYKQNENGDWIEDRKYGKIGYFWNSNKDTISPILDEIMLQDIELREKLDNYYMNTFSGQQTIEGKKRRIEIFIDMLRRVKSKEEIEELFRKNTTKQFTTYKKHENGDWIENKKYGKIGDFWYHNRDVINLILLEIIEQDDELKGYFDDYYMNTSSGQKTMEGKKRRTEIFIDMLKKSKSEKELEELLNRNSSKQFTTYKQNENGEWVVDKIYGKIGTFMADNKDKISYIIEQRAEQDIELREKLDNYYMNTFSGQQTMEGKKRRIEIFIDMLRRVKTKEEIEEFFRTNITKQFTTYKKNENGDWIEDKKYGKIGYFWNNNKDTLNSILEKIVEQDIGLREKLDNYYMNTFSGQKSKEGKKRRAEIFIDMLKFVKDNEEIKELFNQRTIKPFITYRQTENGDWSVDKEYGKIGSYWSNNKNNIIIPQLFFSKEYDNEEYDIARQNIMDYLNSQRRRKKQPEFRTIEEYIDTLDKTKIETKALIELRDLLLSKKEQLFMENQELNQELNTSVRRAM